MKYLLSYKLFESVDTGEFKVGDMVYVDMYSPRTTMYHSGNDVMQRDLPFKVYIGDSNFKKNVKYEIIHIDKESATLYDESDMFEVDLSRLYRDRIDIEFIKECFTSSFEDIIDVHKVEWAYYPAEVLINMNYNVFPEDMPGAYTDDDPY
jgi:hypothetical protein